MPDRSSVSVISAMYRDWRLLRIEDIPVAHSESVEFPQFRFGRSLRALNSQLAGEVAAEVEIVENCGISHGVADKVGPAFEQSARALVTGERFRILARGRA